MDDNDKWPRHYAWEILQMQTKRERTAALNEAPAEWRALIKTHVELIYRRQPRLTTK